MQHSIHSPKASLRASGQHLKRSGSFQIGAVKLLPLMLIALIAASSGVWFAKWQAARQGGDTLESIQQQLTNTLIFPEDFRSLPAFSLVDKNSNPATEALFKDKWSMVFFGFTQCPDICPITLAVVRDALQQMKQEHPDTEAFQVVFVSVDPKRDTPEVLKPYIEFFGDDFIALTGDLDGVLEFTQSLNIVVSYNADEEDPSTYTVDHTASMLLVDPELRVRGKFNPPHEPETISADYQLLLAHLTGN